MVGNGAECAPGFENGNLICHRSGSETERCRHPFLSLGVRASWVLLLACLAGLTSRANEATPKPPLDLSRFRADRILIKPKQGVSLEKLRQLHSRNQCAVIGHFRALGNVQVLRLPQGPPARGLISNYAASALVDYAEPDYLVRTASAFPNDPRFLDGTLWGLNNAGQNGGKANADIDAPEAWGLVRSASNIIVAVLDTGVRYSHEDLSANMWGHSADGSHGTNALTGTTDPNDDSGHGTLVAGVIGASGNNGTGVVGAAWQAQIMACKFVDSLVNWVSVLTNLSTLDGSSVFTNGELPYQPSRFYRAWLTR